MQNWKNCNIAIFTKKTEKLEDDIVLVPGEYYINPHTLVNPDTRERVNDVWYISPARDGFPKELIWKCSDGVVVRKISRTISQDSFHNFFSSFFLPVPKTARITSSKDSIEIVWS